MELRPYQKNAIEHTLSAWKNNDSVLLHLATGTGKTIIFSEICRMLAEREKRVCIVMHLQTLVDQTVKKLSRFWKGRIGIVCASYAREKDSSRRVTVSSIQSLHRYVQKHANCAFDYVIVDEEHSFAIWRNAFDAVFQKLQYEAARRNGNAVQDETRTHFRNRKRLVFRHRLQLRRQGGAEGWLPLHVPTSPSC